jgi:hypothetical protein
VAAEMLPTLQIAAVVVFFVLLIACANVGTLLHIQSSKQIIECPLPGRLTTLKL